MKSTEEGGKEWRGGTLHLHHDHHHYHPLRLPLTAQCRHVNGSCDCSSAREALYKSRVGVGWMKPPPPLPLDPPAPPGLSRFLSPAHAWLKAAEQERQRSTARGGGEEGSRAESASDEFISHATTSLHSLLRPFFFSNDHGFHPTRHECVGGVFYQREA